MGPWQRTCPSPFGDVTVLWRLSGGAARITRVLLPGAGAGRADTSRSAAGHASRKEVDDTAEKITAFLGGADVRFDLEIIDMGPLPAFQKRVLLAEYEIPRGRVSTYGRIAARVGTPKGARAVGRALACNPFPVIIPCHRAIASTGGLGGFQGGTAMKKRLLVNEGVQFIGEDRVSTSDLYY